jgi:DNA polymerase-3 subunit alpha
MADLADSREPQLLAGIVAGLRVVNGQRGRAAIFKLDDGTGAIEAVVNEDLLDPNSELLVDDALLVAQGKVQLDRFSGGLRFNVNQVWSLPAARARFGRHLSVVLPDGMPPIADLVRTWPAHQLETDHGELVQGLAVRLQVRRAQAVAEVDLGDDGRFWPCDEALARWRQIAQGGVAQVVYEPA